MNEQSVVLSSKVRAFLSAFPRWFLVWLGFLAFGSMIDSVGRATPVHYGPMTIIVFVVTGIMAYNYSKKGLKAVADLVSQ